MEVLKKSLQSKASRSTSDDQNDYVRSNPKHENKYKQFDVFQSLDHRKSRILKARIHRMRQTERELILVGCQANTRARTYRVRT